MSSRIDKNAHEVYPLEDKGPRVQDIPLEARPRELFERLGVEHVEAEVLISIILRSGVKGLSVVDVARHLLTTYGSLTAMAQVPVEEYERIKGVGRVRAQVLKSALELGRRMTEEVTPEQPVITTPEEAVSLLRSRAKLEEGEVFWALLLDTKNRLKRPPAIISRGVLDASLVHPREVFREAIRTSSASVVLAHNHPSGDTTPSVEDLKITQQLVEAGSIIGIQVIDHIILGTARMTQEDDFLSLRESGMVDFS